MGSPDNLYTCKELETLDAGEIKALKKRISSLVDADPMVGEIIKAHRAMRKYLRAKLEAPRKGKR
jgi:hypothetical protein